MSTPPVADGTPSVPMRRRDHLRAHLRSAGVDLAVVTSPVNIRYATDYRGYATFQAHIPSQYLLLGPDLPTVLHGAYTDDLPTIDRCDVSHTTTAFDAGLDMDLAGRRFVADVRAALGRSLAAARIAVERLPPSTIALLRAAGADLVDAEPIIELARSRKVNGELELALAAIEVAELGMRRMAEALRAGMTENQLFSLLHATNIEHDGDWIDGRMLCSGPRTNPWYQEASHRVIGSGELVAFDTDMIGPAGYCADISRTWVCDGPPSAAQLDLHARAMAEIEHNRELLHVGASFRELSDRSFRQDERFIANRYACVFHGVGMSDEYPKIAYPDDWQWTGYDGELEEGTVLSVESYVGADDGVEGVKLEQMVKVTSTGVLPLSHFPLSLATQG